MGVVQHGRERHYSLTPPGLAPVAELLEKLSGQTVEGAVGRRLDVATLDALDTEVRRTSRGRRIEERSTAAVHDRHQEEIP